jgi:TetR/AcrR family transcriptional repressor of nem operon
MRTEEPIKTQKQLQSEQTRERVIEEAAKLFVSKGFNGTSISALAKATGLTKGAIYHHYPSKGALFHAVLEMVRKSWSEAVVRDVLKTKNALDRISTLLDNHTRLVGKNEIVCLVMASLITDTDLDDRDSEFAEALREVYAELVKFIERIIEKGQAAGEIRSDLDARPVALNVVGMMRTTCCRMLNQFGTSYSKRMAALREIFVDGLRA